MPEPAPPDRGERLALAERVRAACVRAALEGYEAAGLSGLCAEGRLEAAVDAMRRVDLRALVADRSAESPTERDAR
ncbi:MAG TPA: hypothetical protein VFS40_00580 [Gemmatimonadales bacterium]|nr:hypothetical protein [Gemmatimonadales bacterium]